MQVRVGRRSEAGTTAFVHGRQLRCPGKLCFLTSQTWAALLSGSLSGNVQQLLPGGAEAMGHFDTRKQLWFPNQALRGLDTAFHAYLNLAASKETGPRVHFLVSLVARMWCSYRSSGLFLLPGLDSSLCSWAPSSPACVLGLICLLRGIFSTCREQGCVPWIPWWTKRMKITAILESAVY